MFICIGPSNSLKVLTVLKIKSQYSWTVNVVVLMRYYFDILVSEGVSPVSNVFNNRKRPAASRILLNSIQNACTSINKSCTLIILLRIKDWRKTHTRRTKRFWKKKKIFFFSVPVFLAGIYKIYKSFCYLPAYIYP